MNRGHKAMVEELLEELELLRVPKEELEPVRERLRSQAEVDLTGTLFARELSPEDRLGGGL